MKCECCNNEKEKLLHITITNGTKGDMMRKVEMVPMCMECFLRYAGISFNINDVPDRWF